MSDRSPNNGNGGNSRPQDDYVDIKEAADRLEVSTKTIRRYIQSGRIHADKIRNVWLIPESEIQAMLVPDEPEPAPAAAVDPCLTTELKSALDLILERLGAVERRMNALEGPSDETLEELEDTRARAEQFEEENSALHDEIRSLKQELSQARSEHAAPVHGIKNRSEEVEALKATVISNERGLSLLREEVRHKDAIIKEKELEILQLLDKLKEMESMRKPVKNPPGKTRFWGSFIRGDTSSDRS